MGRTVLVGAATAVVSAVLLVGLRLFGATGAAFAFLVVWAPMTWLGTVSRIVPPRLPPQYHRLRDFERDPRLYELLGVKLVKRLLRRGPLAVFNPGLHLPAERSVERLLELERRMRQAEASHFILLVATLPVVAHATARGWWVAAALTLLFDVLMNGYPVMLQRYNRALLHARFPVLRADDIGPRGGVAPTGRRLRGLAPRVATSSPSVGWSTPAAAGPGGPGPRGRRGPPRLPRRGTGRGPARRR